MDGERHKEQAKFMKQKFSHQRNMARTYNQSQQSQQFQPFHQKPFPKDDGFYRNKFKQASRSM